MPTIRKGQIIRRAPKPRIPENMTTEEREAIDRRVPAARAWQFDEHSFQRSLFAEMSLRFGMHPELRRLFAVPNAGKRTKAARGRLKAEGMKAGVPDIVLLIASAGKHGFVLELKAQDNSPTADQWEWLLDLHRGGYAAHVANDINTARDLILRYLEP